MSRLTDLLRQLRSADPQLGADLEKEMLNSQSDVASAWSSNATNPRR